MVNFLLLYRKKFENVLFYDGFQNLEIPNSNSKSLKKSKLLVQATHTIPYLK